MAKKITLFSMMTAVMVILSAIEHMLPPIPFLPPGARLGLANIVTMYCVFFISGTKAAALNALKSCFILLIRGLMAGALSFCGGMLSICVVIFLVHIFKSKISYIAVSISGAIFHNLGQLVIISFMYGSNFAFYYFPVMLASGVLMGVITGSVLKVILPVLQAVIKADFKK